MSSKTILFVTLLSLTGIACASSWERERFDEVQQFARPEDRLKYMERYSLEDQYRIARFASDHVEPPILELEDAVARQGKAAVPFLLGKLATHGDDDIAVRDITSIFARMAVSRSYDVKTDPTVMSALKRAIEGIRHPPIAMVCLLMLNTIDQKVDSPH